MVIKGEAGMQLMGDWAKGEFIAAGKVPGKDFVCVAAPGTAKAFTFNVDSVRDVQAEERRPTPKAQKDLAAAIMAHRVPGGLQPQQGLDPGAPGHEDGQVRRLRQAVVQGFRRHAKSGTLVPSIAHGMAVPSAAEGAIKDVVSQFWNADKMTRQATAMAKLRRGRKTK